MVSQMEEAILAFRIMPLRGWLIFLFIILGYNG